MRIPDDSRVKDPITAAVEGMFDESYPDSVHVTGKRPAHARTRKTCNGRGTPVWTSLLPCSDCAGRGWKRISDVGMVVGENPTRQSQVLSLMKHPRPNLRGRR